LQVRGIEKNSFLFLNQRIEENDSERFAIEKPHFGTKVCDCDRAIDG
jgi:hypothetical protein